MMQRLFMLEKIFKILINIVLSESIIEYNIKLSEMYC